MDSGTSNSIFNNLNFFPHLHPNGTEVQMGNPNAPIFSLGKGTAIMTTTSPTIHLQDFLYIHNLAINLVSLGQLIPKGCSLTLLLRNQFSIPLKNTQIMSGIIKDNLFFINKGFNLPALSYSFISLSTIHKQFCHPHHEKTCLLSIEFPNLKYDQFDCVSCAKGKVHQQPFRSYLPPSLELF